MRNQIYGNSSSPSVPNMKYHANNWNIITRTEKEVERLEGLQFLSSSDFIGRCVEYFVVDGKNLLNNLQVIDCRIHLRWFFVVIMGPNIDRKIFLIKNTNDLINNIKDINPQHTFLFVNMIHKTPDCCSGVVFSDGDRELRIEISPNTVNTRDLTDGCMDSSNIISLKNDIYALKLLYGKSNPYLNTKSYEYILHELINCCLKKRGYYEFIYGSNQIYSFPTLFFTYYSRNARYVLNKGYKWEEYKY